MHVTYLAIESTCGWNRLEVVLVERIPDLKVTAFGSENHDRRIHEEVRHMAALIGFGPIPVWHSKGVCRPSVAVDLISGRALSESLYVSVQLLLERSMLCHSVQSQSAYLEKS